MKLQIVETPDYILAVSDEEIKGDDYQLVPMISKIEKATKENIHLSYMCYKIIAYQPKGNAAELDLPLLPELTIEDDVEKLWLDFNKNHNRELPLGKEQFIRVISYKAATKFYNEEDLINAYKQGLNNSDNIRLFGEEQIIKDFVKSLEKPRIPKYFIPTLVEKRIKNTHTCEHYNEVGCIKDICSCYSLTPDTLINHQNKTVLIGTYE